MGVSDALERQVSTGTGSRGNGAAAPARRGSQAWPEKRYDFEHAKRRAAMPVVSFSGTPVEYEQTAPRPDLLLLHSLHTDLTVFEPVMAGLAQRYRVTRLNLPGFGASTPAPPDSLREYADYVGTVIDALALPRSAAVFGWGMGGLIALELAIVYGARLDRLIVAGVVPAFPEAGKAALRALAERARTKGMRAVLDPAMARVFPSDFAAAHPEVVAARKERLATVDAECFAHVCLAMARLDLRQQLAKIHLPTLVVCGARDETTPPALVRELAAAIPGAAYREIPGCGHCPMLEAPAALVELVHEFVG
jgi:3-oxoadipate enol-lactonase